ncbi:hypothetical protein Brms1b_000030 [Colletotrichum noveboracense]|nr:hypothetical protein COL940_001645 [Colletotrichum noveboracense]KAJ0325816.1 hypothetical protein Brms1b_000030 [Colletotrichum noveboracense]
MSSQRPDPSQNPQRRDQDFPPLPPYRRLPPLPPLPSNRGPRPPLPPRHRLWGAEPYASHGDQEDPYDTDDTGDIVRAARRQMADRHFQAEYDELLGNFVGNTLSDLTAFISSASDPVLERSRNRNQATGLLETLQNDQRPEDDSRRPATQLPPVFGYRTIRSLNGRQRHDVGAEDDLEAVRALWNQRAQYSSSPFSPPRMPPNLSPPNLSPLPQSEEYPEENRRVKRRKLDSERASQSFKGFRYGRYGQVEPGQLKMEILSCDGGLFENGSSYAYDNILRDDKTVYCTQSNRCNIILKHQGATPFSLKELVIKAPALNYSSP